MVQPGGNLDFLQELLDLVPIRYCRIQTIDVFGRRNSLPPYRRTAVRG